MTPHAPRTAIAGVALKMNLAAVQDMYVAAITQIPIARAIWFFLVSPLHIPIIPMQRARMKTIGPKDANSLPLSGALASATVPKILVFAKYPLPEKRVSHAYVMFANFRT